MLQVGNFTPLSSTEIDISYTYNLKYRRISLIPYLNTYIQTCPVPIPYRPTTTHPTDISMLEWTPSLWEPQERRLSNKWKKIILILEIGSCLTNIRNRMTVEFAHTICCYLYHHYCRCMGARTRWGGTVCTVQYINWKVRKTWVTTGSIYIDTSQHVASVSCICRTSLG